MDRGDSEARAIEVEMSRAISVHGDETTVWLVKASGLFPLSPLESCLHVTVFLHHLHSYTNNNTRILLL